MNPKYDFDDIQDYVFGRMSDGDRLAFEHELEIDPELQLRVMAFQKEKEAIAYLRRVMLREQFSEWRANQPPMATGATQVKFNYRKLMWWLPVFLLLGSLIYFVFWKMPATQLPSPAIELPAPTLSKTDSLPIAEIKTEHLPDWKALSQATYTSLLARDRKLGPAYQQTIADSIYWLLERHQTPDALKLAMSSDTSDSFIQLCIAHIYWTSRNYNQAAYWYNMLKNNEKNVRFKMDATINEIACQIAMLPKNRSKLKRLIHYVLQHPEDYSLKPKQAAALKETLQHLQ